MPRSRSDMWQVTVLTLFPEMFPGPLGHSLAGKALESGIWGLETVDIRGFASDKHRSVDDAPFGGGPGMVMKPEVVDRTIRAAHRGPEPVVYLTPRGRRLEQAMVRGYAARRSLTLLCGRFEGIDERVVEQHGAEEVSLGDVVLSGGEPAAIALIDAVVRLLPGVVGAEEGLQDESFERGLLEYPHYTRPAEWQDPKVPEVGPGDTLRVNVKVIEGTRERVQAFEGVCIARKNAGLNSSFTVRKISYGEGVERVFPLYSPRISAIEVMRHGSVRRAKLYYLRGRTGKAARIAERGYEGGEAEVPETGTTENKETPA